MQAPRLHPICLPRETFPFSLHPSLSHLTRLSVDLASSVLRAQSLSPDEAGQPATQPHTGALRIVHPSLVDAILVTPASPHRAAVSVSDVLTAVHAALHRALRTTDLPAHRRVDVLSYVQSKPKRSGGGGELKIVDLLEGTSVFCGLRMDVAQSNRMLGVIDEMQALTWILLTCEPSGPVSAGYVSPASVGYAYNQPMSYSHLPSQPSQQQQQLQYRPQLLQQPAGYLATGHAAYYH